MALSQAYHEIKARIPRLVANVVTWLENEDRCLQQADEAPFNIYEVVDPSVLLTQWWDVRTNEGWDFILQMKKIRISSELDSVLTRSLTRARSVVRTLLDFAQVFGYKKHFNLAEILLGYLCQDVRGVLIPNLKYHTLWLANKGRHVDPPPRPETVVNINGWLLDSSFRRWTLRRLNRDETFAETMLLGLKRGFPSLDEKALKNEVEGLLKDLSTQHEPTPQILIDEVRRTAREIFRVQEPDPRPRMQFSDRAGFEPEAGIRFGGIRGVVWRWSLNAGLTTRDQGLWRMEYNPYRGIRSTFEVYDFLSYHRIWDGLLRKWILDSTDKRATMCRIAVIFEPLKVRPISAGEALRYGLGKAFQQPLWESLQRFPMFAFTGTPANCGLVSRQMSQMLPHERMIGSYDPNFSQWKSSDFKGATNYMHSDLTTVMLDEIYPDPLWRRIASDLVESHDIHYYDSSVKGRELVARVLQKSGQLMGSMISFPLLCCVNAAVTRLAYEARLKTRLSLRELPVLINGDDLAMRTDSETLRYWMPLASAVGFTESPGKSYLSTEWVQINSRTYNMQGCSKGLIAVQERPYVNFGIVEGFKKGIEVQDEPSLELVAVRLGTVRDEFSGLRPTIRKRVIELFSTRYKERCNAAFNKGLIPYVPSLTNPVELGGLGFGDKDLSESERNARTNISEVRASWGWKYQPASVPEYLNACKIDDIDRWSRKGKIPRSVQEAWAMYRQRQLENIWT
jgi:hypothetical protein